MFNTKLVFVYGTLRPPQPGTPADDSRYYFQIEDCIQTSVPAHLPEATLFDLGTYPAITPGNSTVYGDLLAVRPQGLEIMDRIEGHPTFFNREKVQVQTENGPKKAWVYWAPKGLTIGQNCIANGDWLLRKKSSGDCDPPVNQVHAEPVDPALRELVQQFAQSECSWLSSVRPNGRAHCAPVWHVWYRGRAYVVTTKKSVKTNNLQRNPAVVITHQDPVNPVIIEGWGTFAPGLRDRLQPLFNEKYNWDLNADSEYDTILEITPLKLMAWGARGEGRWDGEAVLRVWAA